MNKREMVRIAFSLLLAFIFVLQTVVPVNATDLISDNVISDESIAVYETSLFEDDDVISNTKGENDGEDIVDDVLIETDNYHILDYDSHEEYTYDDYSIKQFPSNDAYETDIMNRYEANSSGYISKDGKYLVARTEAPTFSSLYSAPNDTETDFYFCTAMNPFCSGTLYPTDTSDGNCTWYAYGRASEILGERAWFLPRSGAGSWYSSDSVATRRISEAELGAIVCWSGHVAVVEWLNEDGKTMIISESSSGSSGTPIYWRNRTVSRTNPENGRQKFYGFIKVGDFEQYYPDSCEMDEGIDKVKEGEYVIVSAKSLDDDNKIRKNRPYVLDIDGSDVIADRSLNEKSSVWSIESEGDRFYSIKNIEKDRVMSLEERGKDRKININIGKWYDDDCESYWAFDEKWTDKFVIYNKHSGMCATISDGDSIKQKEFYGKNDGSVDDQTWLLVYPEKPTIKTNSLPNGEVGKSYKATLTGSCDEWIAIEWSLASDSAALPDGLTISKDGVIGGIPTKAGNYNVKISATNEFGTTTANYTITINGDVDIPVTDVSLDKTSMELKEGNTAGLVATVLPADATNKKISWSTDNAGVATVDENGKVTAVSEGTARITASSADGSNKSATCLVTVTVPGGITIKADDVTGVVGKTISVPVRISGNTGIGGMALTITSDPALTLTEIERGGILAKGNFNTDIKTGLIQWWTSNDNAEGDGVLFILKYDIKSEAKEGKYQISVSCTDGIKANITDKESVTLDVAIDNGSVIISKISIIPGDLTGDGEVAMGDVVKAAKAVAGNAVLTEDEKRAADVTGDGEVAMGDVVKIARYVAGAIKEL